MTYYSPKHHRDLKKASSLMDKPLYQVNKDDDKIIKQAKNDSTIDLGIAIDQAYQEWLDKGNKGSKDDFIRTAPKSLLRSFLKDGGDVKENSYAQLIDDYDNDIEVIKIDGKKESLTAYIIRMGGVDD